MELSSLKKLNAAKRARKAAILLTEIASGKSSVILESDAVADEMGEAVSRAFRSGKSGMVETGSGAFFINVHLPPPRIVVIGAVHISQALAPIAKLADFDIEIIDPRTAFATGERFAGTSLVADWPQEVLGERPLDAFTALVAVTHDPKIDDFPLAEALRQNCFYVGALGSRKTHAKRVERLQEAGLSNVQIDQIHAPIGLDIGASSPAEIAVSIMAQIIEALRKRDLAGAEPARIKANT